MESDKKSDKAEAPLKKGRVIEALETAEDDGRKFIKFTNGEFAGRCFSKILDTDAYFRLG